MSLPVIFSPKADSDYIGFLENMAARNPEAARDVRLRVEASLDRLAAGAIEGPEAELRNGEFARRWVVTPRLVLYYQRTKEFLWILRVHNTSNAPIEML